MASSEVFAAMTAFLDRLEKARIHYSLAYSRQDAVMVQIAVPGERWEVEFMGDGTIVDGAALDELFALFSD
jgi:hypothetical protein